MVESYDNLIHYSVKLFIRLSRSLGGSVQTQAELVLDLFSIQREFLLSSCNNRTPSAGTGPKQAVKIEDIRKLADKYTGPQKPHLKFIADTVGAVGWVVMGNRPSQFIRDSYEKGKRHVRDIKKSSARSAVQALHAEWIKAWQEVILDLESFVREWHPYGLIWGRQG